ARKIQAASMLYALTQGAAYRTAIDQEYRPLLAVIDAYHSEGVEALLDYARAPQATPAVAADIVATFKAAVEGPAHAGREQPLSDPYMAPLSAYTWGSNQIKAGEGNLLADLAVFGADPAMADTALKYAERYAHYLQGVNPLDLVYLSNMGAFGAEKSVTRFYSMWFAPGSPWAAVGASKYGPPPGYLVGGPNPGYAWNSCCPAGCGR